MIITKTRDILNNVFTTTLSFSEFGSNDTIADQEKAILENFPVKISYKDIVFTGKFKVVDGKVTLVDDTVVDADTVSFSIVNKEILVNELFTVKYEVNSNQIANTEVGTNLTTKEQVCEAKVILFESKLIAKITELINIAKTKSNGFETAMPEIITI